MKTIELVSLGLCAALIIGCGGAPAKSSADATPSFDASRPREVATGNTLTEFQRSRLLGHYSTYDGTSGFIFDRTGTPFMAKLDGVDKAMPLTESPSARGHKEYRSADGSIWIRVDDEGNVVLFQGPKQREGVRINRDADAKRLH